MCAEALHPAPQFRMAAAAGHVQRCCAPHLDLEREQHSCAQTVRSPPSSLLTRSSWSSLACGLSERVCSRMWACTYSFLDQRIKLSYASEPILVSFYWLKQHRAGRPLLGDSLKILVTQMGQTGPFCLHPSTRLLAHPHSHGKTAEVGEDDPL